jgi:uncharacterized membrane protein YdjX (TVP38/TMEM64 family)
MVTPRWWEAIRRRRGTPAADRLLRGTGAAALLTLGLASVFPAVAGLVPFMLFTIWTNGPHSPVLVAAYEPVLLLYGRLYPPLLIGALGTVGSVYVEYLNYHLYAGAAESPWLRRVAGSRGVRALSRAFGRAPFLTVAVCALTPIPFWLARALSALTRYPVGRYLWATAIGRFPRLWLFAALGALPIPTIWLVLATGMSVVLAGGFVALRAVRHRRPSGAAFTGIVPAHDSAPGGAACGC